MGRTAEETRFETVQKLLGECFDTSGNFNIDAVDRAHMAKRIDRELRPLGKAPKWVTALQWWTETLENPEINVDYAMMQGALRAVWAAK